MIKLKDIIKESNRLNLFEQTEINLPAVYFDDVFLNNYITVNPGTWEKKANQLIATLKDYRDNKNYEISKLKIDIQGGSSDVPASNIYSGTSEPKHNFGGLMNTYNLKWVKPRQPGGSNIEPDEKDENGRLIKKGGTEGNKWLANARAKSLQSVLVQYIEKSLGEKMKINVVPSEEDRKFANAQIRSAVTPPGPDIKEYVIMYPFFQIGNTKNLVFVNHDSNKSESQPTDGMRSRQIQAAASDANVLFNGFQTYGAGIGRTASKGVRTGAFIKLDNAYKYAGSYAYYKDYDSWLADVQKLNKYVQAARQGDAIKDLSDGPNSKAIFLRGARGYYDPTAKSKYMGLAKFGFGSRNYFSFKDGKPFYLFKPKGDKAKVVADLFDPKGKGGISMTPTIMSNGKPSLLPGGKNSPMSKGPNEIPFFGSEILRTAASYQS